MLSKAFRMFTCTAYALLVVLAGETALLAQGIECSPTGGCPAFQWQCSNCGAKTCFQGSVDDTMQIKRWRCTFDCDADCAGGSTCENGEVYLEGCCSGLFKVVAGPLCCDHCIGM